MGKEATATGAGLEDLSARGWEDYRVTKLKFAVHLGWNLSDLIELPLRKLRGGTSGLCGLASRRLDFV